jgi:predicted DCC family thiol-disulfide oxidoreductase YuxK
VSPTFVFDGDCAFCTMCARFVQRWIPTPAQVVPWQFTDLDALGLTRAEAVEAVQWIEPGARPLAGPAGIAALLKSSNVFWKPVGWLLALRPITAAMWPLYRWIARNRHRLPGGTPACAVPQSK